MIRSIGESTESIEMLRKALLREQEKVRALQEIGLVLGSSIQLDELLDLMVKHISQAIAADRTTIYLIDSQTNELVSKVAQGSEIQEIRLPIGSGIAGIVVATGEVLNIPDAYRDARFIQEWDQRTGYRTRSIICVPMRNYHGRIIGAIQCLNRIEGVFTIDDEALLLSLTSEAAVSIENAKLFMSILQKNIALEEAHEQLEQKVRELDILYEIARIAATTISIDSLLEGVLIRVKEAMDVDAASILLEEPGTGDLHFRASIGGGGENLRQIKVSSDHGICGWVLRHNQPQIVNDVKTDTRHLSEIAERVGYQPHSVLCVPLSWGGGAGVMELLNKDGGRSEFTENDLKWATVIAQNIASAIEIAESRTRQIHQERLSTIGQFLSGVLHDLKSPMMVISNYVKMMVDENTYEQREYLANKILRQVHLLNMMTRETLAFAKGEQRLWVRRVYLYKFFDELKEHFEKLLEEQGIILEIELKDRGIAFFDEEKMMRVLHNLIRNARDAIGDKKGKIQVVVDRTQDQQLKIEVIDDGPGVPTEVSSRIFDSFATHGKKKGTGLGLAIVKSIVDDHGGTISFESSPGRTDFTIIIPMMEPHQEEESGKTLRYSERPLAPQTKSRSLRS